MRWPWNRQNYAISDMLDAMKVTRPDIVFRVDAHHFLREQVYLLGRGQMETRRLMREVARCVADDAELIGDDPGLPR